MSAPMKKAPFTAKTVDVDAFYKGLREGDDSAQSAAQQSPAQQSPQQQAQAGSFVETLKLVSLLRNGPTPTSELFKLSELSLGDFARAIDNLKSEGLIEALPGGGTDEPLKLTRTGSALIS